MIDSAVLVMFSILYSLAVLLLKLRRDGVESAARAHLASSRSHRIYHLQIHRLGTKAFFDTVEVWRSSRHAPTT
jgi:hypothetical protein